MIMANENFQGQNWPNQGPALGTGEGESPLAPPPPQNINVRTMISDLKSMQDTGGAAPRPYTPPPPAPSVQKPAAEQSNDVFKPPEVDNFSAVTGGLGIVGGMPPVPPKPKSGKDWITWVIVAVVVVALGVAGYLFIYPMFSGAPAPVAENNPPAAETPTPPVETPTPPAPPAEIPTPPAATSSETIPATIDSHKSILKAGSQTSIDLNLKETAANINLADFKQALTLAATEVPPFTEFTLKDSAGKNISLGGLMKAMAPTLFNDATLNSFEADFSFFVFTNDKGSWPGIVAVLKTGASADEAKTGIAKIETGSETKNFFLADPGTAQTWKEGQTSGVVNRYLSFSKAGAGLNYGWSGNKLIISTSYDGFKELLKNL
jgi:hypothetical protein